MDVPQNATWLVPWQSVVTSPARVASRRLPGGLPVVQPLVRAQLARLFGAPDLVGTRPPDAPFVGLLAGDAPTRRVLAEPASILGGVRSLMVQATHPLAMAGVAEHSSYRTAPLERLAGTSAWVTATAFASVEVVHAQTRRVRAMHRRVVGRHDGRAYAAGDPRLLVWVSVALTSSLLATHELFAPQPLAPSDQDRFVREQGIAAALLDPRFDLDAVAPDELPSLDVPDLPLFDDGLPHEVAGLVDVLASFGDDLAVIPAAREGMAFLYRLAVPLAVRLVHRQVLDGVAATVPPAVRDALGLRVPRPALALSRLAAVVAALRVTTGRSPSADLPVRSRPGPAAAR